MNFIKQLFSKGAEKHKIKDNDVFIVSYPKSGNTWVRFLIANLISADTQEIDFNNVHNVIPEYKESQVEEATTEAPRFFKSHSKLKPNFSKVIYIVRDGRDVYSSYFNYQKNKFPDINTFSDYLSNKIYGESNSWSEHIHSWQDNAIWNSENLLLIKYEDLLVDSFNQLKKMAIFSGLTVSDEKIEMAIDQSSFNSMRKIEKEKGRKYQDKDSLAFFTRKGVVGDWVNYFDEESVALFKSKENDTLVKFGYETDNNWNNDAQRETNT